MTKQSTQPTSTEKKQFRKNSALLIIALIMVAFTTLITVFAATTTDFTRPTIISASPANIEKDVSTIEPITIIFSEDMNPTTINTNTIIVKQRSTPEFDEYRSIPIEGTVTYKGRTATFIPNHPFAPNQQYGNVFRVTITTGATDLAGNSLSRNYVWSFTTGADKFYTGTSTSQLDQSATPVVGPVTTPTATNTPPIATTPITNAQPASTSSSSGIWIIAALILIFLIIAITALLMKPARQKNKNEIQTARRSPFGDIHPVKDIEGIGPTYNKELQAMGIKNTKQLWNADAARVARETSAPLTSVKSWQNMAELACIKDIGPQYAELLERSGIHSIDQLKSSNPDKLLKRVRDKQDSLEINIQGNSPGHAMVEHWINEAKDHKFSESGGQTA